jgi:hypothetical protein
MVCELDGPTPILYRSKRLVVTDVIVAGNIRQPVVKTVLQGDP